jgi:hypothetical protein
MAGAGVIRGLGSGDKVLYALPKHAPIKLLRMVAQGGRIEQAGMPFKKLHGGL